MTPQNKLSILLLLFALLTLSVFGQTENKKPSLNVTGSYKYIGKTIKKGNDIYGYFGNIKVKQLNKNKIAISFYINMGAKSYNSGSFVDTLEFDANTAIYKIPECDSVCTLTFKFSTAGIKTIHKAANDDYNFSCCFGQGIYANGYFKKTSSSTPIIKEPLAEWKSILPITSSICKKRADGCNMNFSNMAALVPADD